MLEPDVEPLWFTKEEYINRVQEHLARGARVPLSAVSLRMAAGGSWFRAWVDTGDDDALLHVSWGWSISGLGRVQARVFFPDPHKFEREFFGSTCFDQACAVLGQAIASVSKKA